MQHSREHGAPARFPKGAGSLASLNLHPRRAPARDSDRSLIACSILIEIYIFGEINIFSAWMSMALEFHPVGFYSLSAFSTEILILSTLI